MLLGTPLISTAEVLYFVPGPLTPQPPPGGMCLRWDFATTWQGVPWTCPLSICWLGQGRHCLVKPPCPGHPLAGGQHWSPHTGSSCLSQRVGDAKATLGTSVGRKPSPQGWDRKEPVWFPCSLVQLGTAIWRFTVPGLCSFTLPTQGGPGQRSDTFVGSCSQTQLSTWFWQLYNRYSATRNFCREHWMKSLCCTTL